MATKGTRWFLRRSVDLIPYMLFMAAREALVQPREWTGAGVPDCQPVRYVPPVHDGAAGIPAAGITQTAEQVAE
jgi:hypothetical protein